MNQDKNEPFERLGDYPPERPPRQQEHYPPPEGPRAAYQGTAPFETVDQRAWTENAYSPPDQPYYVDSAYAGADPQSYRTGPVRGPEHQDMRERDRQAGQAYARRSHPKASPGHKPSRPQGPRTSAHNFAKILEDLSGFFKGFFSARPSNALRQDLSLPTWVVLLLLNILFFALGKATFVSKSGLGALEALGDWGDLLAGNVGTGWGKAFGLAILEQFLLLVLLFLAALVFSGLSTEKKLPTVQYLKLITYATPLHTLISFLSIFIALFAVRFAGILVNMNRYLLLFSFAYIFDTVYAKERQNRYWLYFMLLFIFALFNLFFL